LRQLHQLKKIAKEDRQRSGCFLIEAAFGLGSPTDFSAHLSSLRKDRPNSTLFARQNFDKTPK